MDIYIYIYKKEEYQELLIQKKNEKGEFDELHGPLGGDVAVEELTVEFEIWIKLKILLRKLPLISYEKITNVERVLESLKSQQYPMGKDWHQVSKYHKLVLPPQGEP